MGQEKIIITFCPSQRCFEIIPYLKYFDLCSLHAVFLDNPGIYIYTVDVLSIYSPFKKYRLTVSEGLPCAFLVANFEK